MGLDNLIDEKDEQDDKSDWGSLTGQKTGDTSSTDKFSSPSITDDSTGLYGYQSSEEFNETVEGKLKPHGDLFKYHMPIFPHIENTQKYLFGSRYSISNEGDSIIIGGKVSAIYMRKVTLSNIPRELIMLDTGETEKDKCYSVLKERFDEDVNDDSTVYLYMFIRTRHITKMAIADEQVDSWSTYPVDRLLKAVYNESYTQEYRETAGGPPELKHPDQIGIWGTADEFGVDKE